MSTEPGVADKPAAPKVKKTVTVNAYGRPNTYGSDREFADALDPAHDYHARSTREKTKRLAVLDDLEIDLYHDVYEDIQGKVDDGFNLGDVVVEERTRTTSEFSRAPSEAVRQVTRDFGETIDPPTGLSPHGWNDHVWLDENDEWAVNIRSSKLKDRSVLTHHDRRTPDTRHESDTPVMSAQWTVELGPATEAEIETWTDAITGPFADHVARLDAIEKVRIANCKERVEREGDCFDV